MLTIIFGLLLSIVGIAFGVFAFSTQKKVNLFIWEL